MCIKCMYAFFSSDWIDNNNCFTLLKAIFSHKSNWKRVTNSLLEFYLHFCFHIWFLGFFKPAQSLTLIFLSSVLQAIWVINYSFLLLKIWKYEMDKDVVTIRVARWNYQWSEWGNHHLFFERIKKEDDRNTDQSVSPLWPLRSLNRSCWKMCQCIWKIQRR